ncbi:cell division protein ZipA [Modicisalibacter ilicicola DSM 19980]|uniref:Cell division protein ZipA n=1 Tax=Modicisalibacter ilicicola DSM 19980 TaxID=1121942 RepID=A0A1M4UXJ9_9GAMM|nr:cell division protein ZipA [Halomonas ilicicola]SHE61389.1 cell division protein ZipA [Halomonas ilicicola DSM 19980]
MELREWLIILGLVLVTTIVVDGVRRLQRQRKVPRLDHADRSESGDSGEQEAPAVDPEAAAREAEVNWELPNGGARVVKPATQPTVSPKPKLQRQDHPGPSKVFSRMAQEQDKPTARSGRDPRAAASGQKGTHTTATTSTSQAGSTRESVPAAREARPTQAREETARPEQAASSSRVAYEKFAPAAEESGQSTFSRAGVAAALRSGGQRVSQSMQRVSSAFHRHEGESTHPHREPSLGDSADFPSDFPESPTERHVQATQDREEAPAAATTEPRFEPAGDGIGETRGSEEFAESQATSDQVRERQDDTVTPHPVVEKARRHHVSAQRARETLAHAEEIIVISVMARNDEGFKGPDLLKLMLACGLRYSEMGIFLRYETEEPESELQFAMVDVIKPGTFDLEAMDDFATPGVTFLMPLPGAEDASAAFEAMVETAMVLVRNLGGELKDENRSVMTAQTVEFARQRVQEFGRRHRLHRYQAN